jgi:hypothetical protein
MSIDRHQKIEALADGFPIDQAFLDAVGERLLIERSALLKNAKAYAETKGIADNSRPLLGRPKGEKSPETIKKEKAYLNFLKAYEKWQLDEAKRTGQKRFGPDDWLKARQDWPQNAKDSEISKS